MRRHPRRRWAFRDGGLRQGAALAGVVARASIGRTAIRIINQRRMFARMAIMTVRGSWRVAGIRKDQGACGAQAAAADLARYGDDHAELNQPDQDDRPERSEDDGIRRAMWDGPALEK